MQPVDSCTHFLLFFQQIITNSVASNNTNLFPYCSVGQESNMGLSGLKINVLAGCVPFFKALGEMFFLAFSSFQESPTFLGSWAPSSIFKASSATFLLPFICCHSSLCESLSTFKNLCDQFVPMWLSQDNLPILKPLTLITPGNSLLLYKLTYLQIPRIRILDTFGESLFYL